MSLTVPYEDRTLRVVTDGHALIMAWSDTPQPEHIRAVLRLSEAQFHRMRNKKHVAMNILIDGTPSFSDEMRRLTAEAAKRMKDWRAASAQVILFGGLRGVVARSISSTVFLLSRSTAPMKVFDTVEAAAEWLLPYLHALEEHDLPRLLRACETARAPGLSKQRA
jgi:hypothetical protein